MDISPELLAELSELSPALQAEAREYISFLRWRSSHPATIGSATRAWEYNLLEHFAGADIRSSREAAGMEVKAAEAIVKGVRLPAIWQHPPVTGESEIEYHVPIPAGLHDLRIRCQIGIRDGAQKRGDRLVAYRIRVAGWQVWSRATWPEAWEAVEVVLPHQAGDVLRLSLITDGLGDHEWAWAVWGEPKLVGQES
jgi:hypothetical protein